MVGLRSSTDKEQSWQHHINLPLLHLLFFMAIYLNWLILNIDLKTAEEIILWNVNQLYERNFKSTYQFPLVSQFLLHNDCEILPKTDQFEKNKNNSIKYTIKLTSRLCLRFTMFFYCAFMICLPNKCSNVSKQNLYRRWGKFPEEVLC